MAEGGGIEDDGWHTDLILALSKQKDPERLRELCRGRKIPAENRADIWKVCLNVVGKPDALSTWDGMLDLNEQDMIRDDCKRQAGKLHLSDDDIDEVAREMESIITFYCKSRNEKYRTTSGLTELLAPLMMLEIPTSDVYNCFYALLYKFIPRDCVRDGKPFHLFRLLLQYHDPELCSFLDSRKLSPDSYCQTWIRSLMVAVCEDDVIRALWDVYLLESDPFLIFFLSLVMIVNARDQVFELKSASKADILEMIASIPGQLEADDIEDFCSLAQYYATRTPQSFRKDYYSQLFGVKTINSNSISQALCLPVSVSELLGANQSNHKDGVRFFVVDCRPAEQYNSGHLPTAFHLDANLMLQAPSEFATAAKALFATQKQSLAAGSVAGGEHLCFMGSGREEEDQYVHMVIANFLQRKAKYVSLARGGYQTLHETLSDDLSTGLADHSLQRCIVCTPEAYSEDESYHELSRGGDQSPSDGRTGLVGMLSSKLMSKGANVKEKIGHFIAESSQPVERHVSSTDKQSKLYRNVQPVFSIDDDDDEGDACSVSSSEDENRKESVNLETWLKRKDVFASFECNEVLSRGHLAPSYILIMEVHMYVLREISKRPGWAHIQHRHHLADILKITSKRKHPELITFKYGAGNLEDSAIKSAERYLIPNSQKATKKIKERILKVIGE
ncbi:TBC1 domain family member 23-like isoform X2 [Actinia tenebrosa]|uniref:TBC1 domain family member 23 n=1 Tax=Actinia tenebrosa TaxID=6105 RepID=A0A6P8HJ50_ACTTE|nr:TBC1 domain family member 23-like isoform X2 [Actinia tenebrosa]